MALAERSTELLQGLPRDWRTAALEIAVEDPAQVERAAVLLGPLTPGRSGNRFRLFVHSGGERLGPTPELVRRVLVRLEEEGVAARLRIVGTPALARPAGPEAPALGLAEAWDALAARLPGGWSDVLAAIRLDSSDHVEQAALLLSPLNPSRPTGGRELQFRVARTNGYGAAPAMARRCLERLDEAGITGSVRVLRVLSDSHNVSTQGPVWRVGGRAL